MFFMPAFQCLAMKPVKILLQVLTAEVVRVLLSQMGLIP